MTNATLKNISIVKGTLVNSEHAIYLKEGAGKWAASNIYVSGDFAKGIKIISTGISPDVPAIASVTDGTITFNPIQFANNTLTTTFVESEYTGSNTTYLTKGTNTGAGNGADAPIWAANWTAGL